MKRKTPLSMRPFFSFYGGKWRDASRYPEPAHCSIIEPFAGSAGYSLRHASANVTLCDLDPDLAAVWRYLVAVKAAEILRLPDIQAQESTDDLAVPEEARLLIGFWLNRGSSTSKKSPSSWMRQGVRPGSFWGTRVRNTIASQVDRIRHWKIIEGGYQKCLNVDATWFIDPPYQIAGRHYRHGSSAIDYVQLAHWCRSRRGRVIVCEAAGSSWLPFRSMGCTKTTRKAHRSSEAVWTNATPGDPLC